MEIRYTDVRKINLGNYESATIGGEIVLTDTDTDTDIKDPGIDDLFRHAQRAWHEVFDPRIEELRRIAAKDSHVHPLSP